MKISTHIPALFETLHKKFGVNWDENIIVTIGDTIYLKDPTCFEIRPDLMIHEKIHEIQQRDFATGAKGWWDKYLADSEFRLKEELAAYQGQMFYIKGRIKDRNKLFPFINSLALELSGPMYGKLISYKQAYNLLK